ncbi:MAG: efflux RND transporter periplasmic adaptor subunit [Bacteroidetes bacterium]|nr:efflux RND transporter periplasmic adaptor subunit [Bacteroidota bacterium]MCL2302560.1 efflux RND transporter periplasmic adaptor subunit [Lentimicrobiaceae bacterium]
MKRNTLWVIIPILMAAMSVACSQKKSEDINSHQTAQNDTVRVRVAEVHEQMVAQIFEYTAVIRPEAVNNIAPTVPGRIDRIFVEIGDFVTVGQKLVQMDATQLRQAKTQLDNLKASFKRLDELYKVGGVSKSDWDAMKTQLDVAQNTYDNLSENTQLVSPLNGVVTMRNYDSGDLFTGNPILQIQQIRPVKLVINVSESQYNDIKKGMEAKIQIDILGKEEYIGRVSLIHPTLDARTHTFPVEITIPNANAKVRPGMYARAVFNLGSRNNVVVPDNAIVKQPGSGDRYVYLLNDDNTVSYVQVMLGRRLDANYEVLSGLKDGDKVAVTSLTRLKDGINVQVVE